MKKMIMLIFLCVFANFVMAQVPEDVDTGVYQKVSQEHANTRTFISNEITRQMSTFYAQFDEKAQYYENRADRLLSRSVWKFSLLMFGIILIWNGFFKWLEVRLRKRELDKIKKTIRDEVTSTIMNELKIEQSQQEKVAETQDSAVKIFEEEINKDRAKLEQFFAGDISG